MSAIRLVRHGQASFGAADYDQLSELGRRQAALLGEALAARGVRADVVVCGGMKRHRQTADACLLAMGATTAVSVDGGWDEYDHDRLVVAYEPRFGDRQALAAALVASGDGPREFQRIFAAAMARWVSGAHDGDYGETFAQFGERVRAALARLAARLAEASARSQSALVFTSGGPISAVAGQLLQVPEALQLGLGWTLANSGVTKIIAGLNELKLSTLNEHGHLEGHATNLITYR